MVHNNRRFCMHEVASLGELVENFTQHTWTLCTAFSLQGLLFKWLRVLPIFLIYCSV